MSGWMWFVLGCGALVVIDQAVANVCKTFGNRTERQE